MYALIIHVSLLHGLLLLKYSCITVTSIILEYSTWSFPISLYWYETLVISCKAPIPRIRRRHGDVHTRGENTLTRTLSLSTVNNSIYTGVPAGNKYKNTCRKGLVIITDIETGITKITAINHKDTYKWARWWISYVNPMDCPLIR